MEVRRCFVQSTLSPVLDKDKKKTPKPSGRASSPKNSAHESKHINYGASAEEIGQLSLQLKYNKVAPLNAADLKC